MRVREKKGDRRDHGGNRSGDIWCEKLKLENERNAG